MTLRPDLKDAASQLRERFAFFMSGGGTLLPNEERLSERVDANGDDREAGHAAG
jgi:hypothetical protein